MRAPRPTFFLAILLACASVLISSCAAPYYEQAIDPPGLSYGGGGGLRMRFFSATDEDWAYGLGPMASGYVRYHPDDKMSYAAQADFGHTSALSGYSLRPPDHTWDADLVVSAKAQVWHRAAVKLSGGAMYVQARYTYFRSVSEFVPVLDLTLLQDFGGRYPMTGRVSLGASGLHLGIGLQQPITARLRIRTSLGLSLVPYNVAPVVPVPLAYFGLSIEAGNHESN